MEMVVGTQVHKEVFLIDAEANKFLAKASGFSLHAGVACKSDERKKRERICRYISRPSLSEDRLSLNARGQVVYKLKKPWPPTQGELKSPQ